MHFSPLWLLTRSEFSLFHFPLITVTATRGATRNVMLLILCVLWFCCITRRNFEQTANYQKLLTIVSSLSNGCLSNVQSWSESSNQITATTCSPSKRTSREKNMKTTARLWRNINYKKISHWISFILPEATIIFRINKKQVSMSMSMFPQSMSHSMHFDRIRTNIEFYRFILKKNKRKSKQTSITTN